MTLPTLSVRTKLTAGAAVILVVAATVFGALILNSVRTTQIDQVDARLVDVSSNPAAGPGRAGGPPPEATTEPDFYRAYAEVAIDPGGTVIESHPSGFPGADEPLPDLDGVVLADLIGSPATVPASDGAFDYRVIAVETPTGDTIVTAASLRDEDDAISDLRRVVVLSAIAVTALATLAVWVVVGRALRPVGRMIDTAGSIAAGDLSQRIDHPEDDTELGRLARALDEMIEQLDTAFTARERSEARLRRFAADASHELRTPIAAIHGYAQLYQQGGIPPGEALDRAVARIASESERMGRLVEDLLLLARLDQQQPLERTTVDLAEIAADAVDDLRAVEPLRPITLDAPEPSLVDGDERRLHQVTANLLANARVHTPAGTPIEVSVRNDGTDAILTVADDGPGIDPAVREQVFERFFRADKARKVGEGGSGLGLSIVAGVVRAHGGDVHLDPDRTAGTAVIIRLPRQPASEQAAVAPPTHRSTREVVDAT